MRRFSHLDPVDDIQGRSGFVVRPTREHGESERRCVTLMRRGVVVLALSCQPIPLHSIYMFLLRK